MYRFGPDVIICLAVFDRSHFRLDAVFESLDCRVVVDVKVEISVGCCDRVSNAEDLY